MFHKNIEFLRKKKSITVRFWSYHVLLCVVDIHECNNETDGCSDNATCTNIVGSYVCMCLDGFTGDGLNCSGGCRDFLTNLQYHMSCTQILLVLNPYWPKILINISGVFYQTSTNAMKLRTCVPTTLLATTRSVLMSASVLMDSLGMDSIVQVQ